MIQMLVEVGGFFQVLNIRYTDPDELKKQDKLNYVHCFVAFSGRGGTNKDNKSLQIKLDKVQST